MSPVLKIDIELKRGNFQMKMKADIPEGITGVFGPSGHGKTTLLNAIAGLIQPASGYIKLNGDFIFHKTKSINIPCRNRHIGYVFQDDQLFPHLSIEKNLMYGFKNDGLSNLSFEGVVEILEIHSILKKKPDECSGGEKQRVAIGRALLSSPQVLIMDEPFSAVDVRLRKSIIPYLIAVNRKFRIPIIVVSHDLPDLLSLTSFLLLLNNGTVWDMGNFQDIIVSEKNLELLQGAGLYNVFQLKLFGFNKEGDIALLRSAENEFTIQALFQSLAPGQNINDDVKVLIRPEDIALSLSRIEGISLRNQIKGTITKVFHKDGHTLCLVDAGEKMIVEITDASRKNMNLHPGTIVYILFKSVAINLY